MGSRVRLPHLTYCVALLPAAPDRSRRWLVAVLGVVLGALVAIIIATIVVLTARPGGDAQSSQGGDESDVDVASLTCCHIKSPSLFVATCLVSRDGWVAAPHRGAYTNLTTPVDTVIIQHTVTDACVTRAQCIAQTRDIQEVHMKRKWDDIGYNFLVGGDGLVYMGRGWDAVGAHTQTWNTRSIGVGLIGTFTKVAAFPWQLCAVRRLLDWGLSLGKLTVDYRILGASQVCDTESPGKFVMRELPSMMHWRNFTSRTGACNKGKNKADP